MRESSVALMIFVALFSLTFFFVTAVSALNGKVKFRGLAATNEEWGETVCYGSYYCNVTVEEILYDPNNTLSLEDVVTVCYNESLGIEIGDQVECYGYYWKEVGPMQCVGKVECIGNDYYVIPEFPSFLILPLFMIATLLAVIVYRRKHSPMGNEKERLSESLHPPTDTA